MAYLWPTTQSLRRIEAVKVDNLLGDDPLRSILPMVDEDTYFLEWEVEDNNYGLQQARGLDGEPYRVNKWGSQRYKEEPGVYGEFYRMNETEMTILQREVGTANEVSTIERFMATASSNLAKRFVRRYRQIGWSLLTTGSFSVAAPNGQTVHKGTYSLQTYDASTWGTAATATPLTDLGALVTLGPAVGTNFAGGAKAYMNDATYRKMAKNTNAADLGGRRVTGLSPVNTRNGINELLTGDNLANIVVYDDFYLDDGNNVTRFIPDNKVVVVGQRPGNEQLGEYAMTLNANTGRPGAYNFVNDTRGKSVPPVIELHSGHNGGPILWYPGSIIIMDVS